MTSTVVLERNVTIEAEAIDDSLPGLAPGAPSSGLVEVQMAWEEGLNGTWPVPATRVFHAVVGTHVTLRGLMITRGRITGVGGAIYSQGASLTLEKCWLRDNQANTGGAVYSTSALLMVRALVR